MPESNCLLEQALGGGRSGLLAGGLRAGKLIFST